MALTGEAYAVFDSADGSFKFFRDEEGKYTQQQVIGTKTYYTGIETSTYTSASQVPWYDQRHSVQSVIFEDTIKPISNANWFYQFNNSNFTEIKELNLLDTSGVTNMYSMFYNCLYLTTIDVSHFDTSKVTNMERMFSLCANLTTIDVSHFDTSKVTNMERMFNSCSNLTTILNIMNMPTNYDRMCYYAATASGAQITLKYIDPVTSMNVDTLVNTKTSGNVINGGEGTFIPPKTGEAYAVFDSSDGSLTFFRDNFNKYTQGQVIGDKTYYIGIEEDTYTTSISVPWYIQRGSVKSVIFDDTIQPISTAYWFYHFTNNNFTEIIGLEKLDTSNVVNMRYMFYGCRNLTILDISYFDTNKVTNMVGMFGRCSNLQNIYISNLWTTEGVSLNSSDYMFNYDSELPNYTFSINDKTRAYAGVKGYLSYKGGEAYAGYDSSDNSLTFFRQAEGKYTQGQIIDTITYYTGIETTVYTSSSGVPWKNYTYNIKSIIFNDSIKPVSTAYWFMSFDNDKFTEIIRLKKLDTSNVTTMRSMFNGCQNLTSLDLSNFDTSNVTNMYSMFYDCINLTLLDLNNFNTSNVTDMGSMFCYCENLTSLNLSNFNTSKVTDMSEMFHCCENLTSLNLSNFDTSKVTDMNYMFCYCRNLITLDVSRFDTSNVRNMILIFYSSAPPFSFLTLVLFLVLLSPSLSLSLMILVSFSFLTT